MKTHFLLLGLIFHAALSSAAPGDIDLTFNPGTGANQEVHAMAFGSNGTIYIAGEFTTLNNTQRVHIGRLLNDGTVDFAFDPQMSADSGIYSIALTSNGKVVIGGNFATFNSLPRGSVARLRDDGSLDLAFGNPGFNSIVTSVTVLAGDQVLAVGSFSSVAGTPRRNVARLNANGTLDASFNPCSGISNTFNVFTAVLQPDGKVIIAGNFTNVAGTVRYYVARVMQSGILDPSFDCGFVGGANISHVWLQPDGKVIIGGAFNSIDGYSRIGIARLNTNGVIDTSFLMPNGLTPGPTALAFQPDGRLVVGGGFGVSVPGFNQNYLVRLNSNGSIDPTLRANINSALEAVLLQAEARILVGGLFNSVNSTNLGRVARLQNDLTSAATISQVGIGLHAGITLNGSIGGQYRIEYVTNLVAAGMWTPLTNVTLESPTQIFYDPQPIHGRTNRFYRVVQTGP